jgi:hypothetical protein
LSRSGLVAVVVSAVLGLGGGVAGGLVLGGGSAHGPDPLGLGVSLVDQGCTGKSLLVTASGKSQAELASAVAENPDHTRYLAVDASCATAWRQGGAQSHGYVTYLGPYDSVGQACAERMTVAHRGDLVTRLEEGTTQPVQCLCYVDFATMPKLRLGMDATARDGIYVRALQKVLATLKLNPSDTQTGIYDQSTVDQVKQLQSTNGLRPSGVVDSTTWHTLLGKGCPLYKN